jgi:PAS domain S-box-containing protein
MSSPQMVEQKSDLFRLLVERVKDYAIFVLDPAGIVSSWNDGAEHIKGYQATEIIGHHFSRFYPAEAIHAGWPATELELAKRDGRFEDEGWRIRKDGSKFWANVVLTALYDDDGVHRGFAKVTRDLTDRMRLQRLEADAQVMSQFVAMLAHELRNPLAPIRHAVTVAQHPAVDPPKLGWALSVIDRQSNHLAALVNDLLDVGRITSGRVRLEFRRVRLAESLQHAVEATRGTCDEKRHALTVNVERDPIVRGDPVRLTQILSNILMNACKYTPAGGRVDVTLGETGGNAHVAVRDSGIGIPADLLPRIFDLFTQDQRALDRSEGGLGLGLTIARNLAELHHGTLRASSEGRGCGSEFVFELPRLAATDDERPDQVRVLVVDDNKDAALSLQAMIELSGHRCSVAFDGDSALVTARSILPDVALLDIGLPGMSGYELARKLRGLPELRGIFLAAVTGYSSDEDKREAIDAGFDVHFAKPVEYSRILEAVPALQAPR